MFPSRRSPASPGGSGVATSPSAVSAATGFSGLHGDGDFRQRSSTLVLDADTGVNTRSPRGQNGGSPQPDNLDSSVSSVNTLGLDDSVVSTTTTNSSILDVSSVASQPRSIQSARSARSAAVSVRSAASSVKSAPSALAVSQPTLTVPPGGGAADTAVVEDGTNSNNSRSVPGINNLIGLLCTGVFRIGRKVKLEDYRQKYHIIICTSMMFGQCKSKHLH